MFQQLSKSLTMCCLMAAFSLPTSALEYTFDGPEGGLFGKPTSDDTIYVTTQEPVNTDRSKNAALIPPPFGSPTSYTLHSGQLLTPNLVGQGTASSIVGEIVMPPTIITPKEITSSVTTGYTRVEQGLYFSAGHLGALSIPAIGLSVRVYEGTNDTVLKKNVGHFENTSIWDGNVALAGHNRGVNNHFGKIHTLKMGDTIHWSTKLGIRKYQVFSVRKVSVSDLSVLNGSVDNIITLITCVQDQPDYRWCVQARA